MARILNDIIAIGGTTAHSKWFDAEAIIGAFIAPKRGISCFVALSGSQLVGFQALEWSDPDWPGDDRLPADWGIISTYVDPQAHQRGAGRALFTQTAEAAGRAGVRFIDATVRVENTGGQAYYDKLGFTDYRQGAGTVCKRFVPTANESRP